MEFIKIDIDKLVEEYNSGMSLRKLALKYNTSKLTIKRKLEKRTKVLSSSEWISKNKTKHTEESSNRCYYTNQIIDLYNKYQLISKVASELNISKSTVTNHLKKNNVDIKKIDIRDRFADIYDKVKPEWFNKSNLEDLYNSGMSINDIANKYDYDPEAVRCMFIKLGISRRSNAEANILAMKKKNYESSLERIIKSILDDFNIKHKKVSFGGYEFDLLVDDKHLIEINGNFIHNEWRTNDSEKHGYWAENLQNYTFDVIWEHEFLSLNSIFNRLNEIIKFKTEHIELDKLEFKLINNDLARVFYDKYHYKGKARSGVHVAALYQNEIVCCSTFSNSTRKESADRLKLKSYQLKELIRFVINPKYTNKNLGSYCMSRFINFVKVNYEKVKCLISFAENDAGHYGGLYKASNWDYDGNTNKSYYYIKGNSKWHKKTIWDYSKIMKMSENEFVKLFNIEKICSGSKSRYLYWIK